MEHHPQPSTCITPKPSMSQEISYVTSEKEVWFSDIPQEEGGFDITYKADSNQLNFLKMLSSKASQNITYHCFNSVAYKNAKRGNMRQALELMSSNDLELRHRGKFRYKVITDECQVSLLNAHNIPSYEKHSFILIVYWIAHFSLKCSIRKKNGHKLSLPSKIQNQQDCLLWMLQWRI